MAVYKPYGKTASGKEEIKIPYSSIDGTPTIPTKVGELENDSGFTTNTGTITGINMNGESKGTSGVVDLGTVITDVTDKQDKLTAEQLNAVNSGITADKVSTYDGYATTINGKQNKLSTTQLDAVNSGITSGKVTTYDGYASKISTLESKPGLDKVGTVTAVKINGETKNPASGVVDLGTFLTAQDISGKANLDGGNTFKGKQTFTDPPIDNPYSIDASGYVRGSLLQSSAVAKKDTNADKVCVFISGGFIYYRTPAEIVSDGGGATTDQIHNGTLTIQKNGTKVQTFSANQSGNVTANITVPTKVSELENDSGFTSNAGTVTSVAVKMNGKEKGKVTSSGTIDLGTVLTNDGGTINKSKTVKMDASANSDGANLKWGTVNSKNPYIGYASDQVDGTFVVGSLLGTNYASGLAIGGGSGNLLWKGTKVATINDIPNVPTFHLYEHNIYLSCSKGTSTSAPSRAYVYFTVITTSATAWNWNTLISPNYFAGKSIEINAGGYGYIADPEGNNRSYNGSVQTIYFNSSYIVVEMVYNNSLLGIDNEHSGGFFYKNDVTITDKVRTIL